ncbi:MAG: hypothetical protein WC139_12950 [Candidatus Kapaibacterium sp.]
MEKNILNIAVGTLPTGGLDLHKELSLIKAGILYGDKITLYNLKANLFQMIAVLTQVSEGEQLALIENLIPTLLNDENQISRILNSIEHYKTLNKIKHPTKKIFIERQKLKNTLSISLNGLRDNLLELCYNAGLNEIAIAIKNQLLEIKDFDVNQKNNLLIKEFITELAKSIDDSNTYPLFDYEMSDIMKTAISEGMIQFPNKGIKRGNNINLVYNLFERLPLFENTTMDEIVDIRKDLSKPLIRFRSAIIKISKNIENEFWDNDFESDIHNIIIQEIEPVILEIEEETNQNKYLKGLLITSIKDYKRLISIPVLGIMISKYTDMSSLILESVSMAIPATITSVNAYLDWKKKQNEIEKNHLFFYYKLKQKLS